MLTGFSYLREQFMPVLARTRVFQFDGGGTRLSGRSFFLRILSGSLVVVALLDFTVGALVRSQGVGDVAHGLTGATPQAMRYGADIFLREHTK